MDFVTSDDHQGLKKAIETYLQGTTWQRCQTHFMKNILDVTPKAIQEEIHSRVRGIFEAANLETARFLLNQTLDEYDGKAPHAMEVLENGFDDATAVLELPKRYRTKLRTTNSLERVNEEIRRRISSFTRSKELVVRSLVRYRFGSSKTAVASSNPFSKTSMA